MLWSRSCQGQRAGETPWCYYNFYLDQRSFDCREAALIPTLLIYYSAPDLCGGPWLVVELRLWASMQDSGRLRPQSNSTMQAGTAKVCILSVCGVGALQADRLGVSRPQLQVQVQVQMPGAEAPRPARQAILTVEDEPMHICRVDHYQYYQLGEPD